MLVNILPDAFKSCAMTQALLKINFKDQRYLIKTSSSSPCFTNHPSLFYTSGPSPILWEARTQITTAGYLCNPCHLRSSCVWMACTVCLWLSCDHSKTQACTVKPLAGHRTAPSPRTPSHLLCLSYWQCSAVGPKADNVSFVYGNKLSVESRWLNSRSDIKNNKHSCTARTN